MDAPLGRALLGKQIDSEVVITAPDRERTYYVSAIRYKPSS
jgi:transcription elongation factor GreB